MKEALPKYQVVKEYILAQIKKGVYLPHQIIESELELMEKLNVSRITIRRALEELVHDKVLTKKKGVGTFVNPLPKYTGFKPGVSFTLEAKNRGMLPSTELLQLTKVFADDKQAEDMQVAIGDPLWLVERIRYADNVAVSYELEYFDHHLVGDLTEEICEHSIYEFLEKKGIEYEFVDQKISAVLADETSSNHLSVPIGSPLISIKNIACLKNGKPFNVGFALYQTDSFYLMHTIYR
ncbi:GntR family transcriptional regulator [Alkalihalobacillus clausii]|jgi:GntR family transcriptional regulator|uniref:GntR family transcriptional regulator n=1 Tax=Shouchella clausii TaxID=79880 RepID=UPI00203DDB01|nr:GntR family transcriptional regulator [Shouchella clausii]MCM3549513.1 GntR family transcriptional regulator [Shouchella clausii]